MCNWFPVGCAIGARDKNASVEGAFRGREKKKGHRKIPRQQIPPRWVFHFNVPLTTLPFGRSELDDIDSEKGKTV